MDVDPGLRHAVAAVAPQGELERLADGAGRRSLRHDGLIKARRGQTTAAEVARVAGAAADATARA